MKIKKLFLILILAFSIALASCSSMNTDEGESGTNQGWNFRPPTPAPTPTSTDEPDNKGVLITMSMPDNSAYAVFVGVNDYQGGDYDLTYCGNDAIDFKDSFNGSTLWTGATVTIKTDIHVTEAEIQSAITTAKNTVADGGLFVFTFSGHGTNSGSTGYLVPFDAIDDSSKLISETELQTWLGNFTATVKKVIFLDSCHSGAFVDQKILEKRGLEIRFAPIHGASLVFQGEDFGKTLTTVDNLVCVTACAGDEVCWGTSAFQNGVFSYYVTAGLGSGATIGPADTNVSNSITSEEVHSYAGPLATTWTGLYCSSVQNAKIGDSDNTEDEVIKN